MFLGKNILLVNFYENINDILEYMDENDKEAILFSADIRVS